MSIPEDMIIDNINMLMTSSEGGDTLHHLHVVTAPRDAIGPLGIPDEKQLSVAVYVIAPDETVDAQRFIMDVVLSAAANAFRRGDVILFAALSQEAWTVDPMDDLAEKLLHDGRLQDHPNVAKMTVVYAACRDGRRWRGRHYITGPKAGTVEDVDLLVGAPLRGEAFGMPSGGLVRGLVGLR